MTERNMLSLGLSDLLAGCVIALGSSVPRSALADSFVNDGTYVDDTTTGLNWLNLSQTLNQSAAQVQTELNAGWQVATTAQVTQLFSTLGLFTTQYSGAGYNLWFSTTGAAYGNSVNAQMLFGPAYYQVGSNYGGNWVQYTSLGYYNDGGTTNLTELDAYDGPGGPSVSAYLNGNYNGRTAITNATGWWLVQSDAPVTPTPTPATFNLQGGTPSSPVLLTGGLIGQVIGNMPRSIRAAPSAAL